MRIRLALLAILLTLGAAPPPDGAVRDARAEMLKHSDGFFLDDDPASPARLERWWEALRTWTASRIEREGAASLPAAARVLDKDLDMKSQDLPGSARLVTASAGSFGTAFILAPGADGRLQTAWSIDSPQGSALPDLEAWRATHVRGPLSIDQARLLPPERGGASRFLLLGTYSAYAGATVGGQVSIWRWTGRSAEPLIVRHFAYMVDQRQPLVSVDGNRVRIGAKSQFKRMMACGACEGRQVELDYRLDPSSVVFVEEKSLVPELDTVDELFDLYSRGRTTRHIAARGSTPGLITFQPDKNFNLGLMAGWKAKRTGATSQLCLAFESYPTINFDMVRNGSKFRITATHPNRRPGCGPDART